MKPIVLYFSILTLVFGFSYSLFFINDYEVKSVVLVSIGVGMLFLICFYFLKKDPQYQQNIILLGGLSVTMISWSVNGYISNQNEIMRNQLSIQQSILQSKRDLKIKFLLDAYFRLENSDGRGDNPKYKAMPYNYIYQKYSESALTSVQLLADSSTVLMANKFVLSGGNNHLRELLLLLRSELRTELSLRQLPNDTALMPTYFREYRTKSAPDILTPEQQYQLIIRLNEFDRELIK